MKPSRYNFFFEGEDGSILAYNALRNGLAVVDAEIKTAMHELEPGGEPRVDAETLAELRCGGFVIPDDLDELGVGLQSPRQADVVAAGVKPAGARLTWQFEYARDCLGGG